MNGFAHLGRRGGPFAPSLKLGRGVFCNRSGSGLFRRDGLPPFPRVCNFTQLVAEEFNTGARIFVGGVEAAQAALAPGADTNITFVVDCRHDQGLGRHGFCVTASCQPPRDAALPLQIRQSPALLIWPIPRGAWLLHPHGLGRSPHPRHREALRVDPRWVTRGPGRNYIKIAATRLAAGNRPAAASDAFTEQEYDLFVQVLLGIDPPDYDSGCLGASGRRRFSTGA